MPLHPDLDKIIRQIDREDRNYWLKRISWVVLAVLLFIFALHMAACRSGYHAYPKSVNNSGSLRRTPALVEVTKTEAAGIALFIQKSFS